MVWPRLECRRDRWPNVLRYGEAGMFRRSVTTVLAVIALAMVILAPAASAAPGAAASPFVGSWTVEQVPPGGGPHSQGTLVLTQNGNELSGVLRLNGAQFPVSDVDDTGGVLSF